MENEKAKTMEIVEHLKELKNSDLRVLTETYYDIQKLRTSSENRLRTYMDAGLLRYVDMDEVVKYLRKAEKESAREIEKEVSKHPLWTEWLKDVKGVGEVMAGGLIAWIDDIGKFRTISKLWKYSGLAPGQRKERGQRVNYNPKMKSHLWRVGMQLLKAKNKKYAPIYYEWKDKYYDRVDIREKHERGEARGGMKSYHLHIHQMALRKMIKRFLIDLWLSWRQIEGLPTSKPYIFSEYAERKGIKHDESKFEMP